MRALVNRLVAAGLIGLSAAVQARAIVLEPLTYFDAGILNEDYNPSWSSDGSRVLFVRSQTCCGPYHPIWWAGIHEVVLGGIRTSGFPGNADPVQSAAGEYAYTVDLCASTQVICVDSTYVAVGNPSVRLTFGARHDREPAWSPDGTRIAFTSDRSANRDIWIVSRSGGALVQLTHDPADDANPAWSPDGTRIAFTSKRMGDRDLWIAPVAGGTAMRLTDDPADDFDPTWSPDGNLIAFASKRSGNGDLYVVRVGSGEISQVTNTPGDDREPDWSPDGSRIVFVSDYSLWLATDLLTVPVQQRTWSEIKRKYR